MHGLRLSENLADVGSSPGIADDTSEDEAVKPAAKKSKQMAMTDFLQGPARKISKSMKPASPPKKRAATKVVDEEEGRRRGARSRSAAVKQYVEIDSDSEGGDESMFE